MKISVAMTTYNSEKYLLKQIMSLITQTKKIDEIIISDDFSQDSTEAIVESVKHKFPDQKIVFLKNKQNVGFVKNFTKAINHTEGDIIFLCDHDDIWHEDKVQKTIEQFSCDEVLCVGVSFRLIDGDDNLIDNKHAIPFFSNNGLIKKRVKENTVKKILFKDEFSFNFTPGCCLAFRKEIKMEVIESINISPHDYLISLYASIKAGLFFYNSRLIDYRLHDSNCIGLPQKFDYDNRKKTVEKDYTEKLDLYNSMIKFMNNKQKKQAVKILNLYQTRNNLFQNKKKLKMFFFVAKNIFCRFGFAVTLIKDLSLIRNKQKNEVQ